MRRRWGPRRPAGPSRGRGPAVLSPTPKAKAEEGSEECPAGGEIWKPPLHDLSACLSAEGGERPPCHTLAEEFKNRKEGCLYNRKQELSHSMSEVCWISSYMPSRTPPSSVTRGIITVCDLDSGPENVLGTLHTFNLPQIL